MTGGNFHVAGEPYKFIFNNVIFPPKLPQQGELDEWRNEQGLLSLVTSTAQSFADGIMESGAQWSSVHSMLDNFKKIEKQGSISADDLLQVLQNVRDRLGAMACFVRTQNCGWIMQYDGDSVIVDAFEASPTCASVLSANDRLVRHFPGKSVKIPHEIVKQPEFCKYLARELSRLSNEQVDDMLPTTRKAQQDVPERRDTAHPGLVTENLMNQLLALGSYNDCSAFTKHTRDEVNWDSCKSPWRRSPFWLVLRVTLQVLLRREFGPELGRSHYKNFMVYLICQLGELALELVDEPTPDILSLINLKIGRRVSKLGNKMFEFVSNSAHIMVTRLYDRLEDVRCNANEISVPRLSEASVDDLAISLTNSRAYFEKVMAPSLVGPQEHCALVLGRARKHFDEHRLPDLDKSDDYLALADFERWVERHLHDWAAGVNAFDDYLQSLALLVETYLDLGNTNYSVSIKEKSLMFLVILELWVAMDKMCISLYPLLEEYSPPVPVTFLEPLLLPEFQEMQRASAVESYLRSRHAGANPKAPDILSDPVSNSFAVRFFDSSNKHQNLRKTIERQAETNKANKEKEWERLSTKYSQLMAQTNGLSCSYCYTTAGPRHEGSCRRCYLDNQAKQLQISVHEWPLPSDENKLKTAIFELDCPRAFLCWRDVSWLLIHDLGRESTESGQKIEHDLIGYSELSDF